MFSNHLAGPPEHLETWRLSVRNVVEFPGAGLGRIRTINSKLTDADLTFETTYYRSGASLCQNMGKTYFQHQFSMSNFMEILLHYFGLGIFD